MLSQQTPEQSSKNHINTYSPIVTKIFSYIEAHYREKFSIKHLADELHHNADYLTRCFKKTTGCSIQQFVIAKRVNLAQKLLREGNTPLDACYLSGFENYSNFSRTFTKHTGISPKKYQINS
jgi:YesN/AraC family two-component response regulator